MHTPPADIHERIWALLASRWTLGQIIKALVDNHGLTRMDARKLIREVKERLK